MDSSAYYYPDGEGYALILGNYTFKNKPSANFNEKGIIADCTKITEICQLYNCQLHQNKYFLNCTTSKTTTLFTQGSRQLSAHIIDCHVMFALTYLVQASTALVACKYLLVYISSHGVEGCKYQVSPLFPTIVSTNTSPPCYRFQLHGWTVLNKANAGNV